MPEISVDFSQVLAEEKKLVQQFVDVLKREQSALRDGRIDELPDHNEQKAQLVTDLNRLAEQRRTFLASHQLSNDKAGVDRWCAAHPDQKDAARQWADILSFASEARELNRLNGELIQLRMQHNIRALEALQGGKDALDLYGPDGQSTPRSKQRINDAV